MNDDRREERRARWRESPPPQRLLHGGWFGMGVLIAGVLAGGRSGEVIASAGALLTLALAILFFARLLLFTLAGR